MLLPRWISDATRGEISLAHSSDKTRLAIAGATGKMGRCILQIASADDAVEIVAALARPKSPLLGQPSGNGLVFMDRLDAPCDVLIDFTVADGTMSWLEVCRSKQIPMVIGATGQSNETLREIRAASTEVAMVIATNFSIGVHVLSELVGEVARRLGPHYDIELVETHHRRKIDAPSGTAISLVERIRGALAEDNPRIVHGRHGSIGPRPHGEIGIHSLRMGDVIGEHVIHFSSDGETLTLRHTAQSRDAFSAGALRAAKWIVGQPPGLYGMTDVLKD